jgi:hypothetical protein
MIKKFDIRINLNGWFIPFGIETKGYGVFKVTYESTLLGHLLLNESSKWIYLNNVIPGNLLNLYTADKISEAIVNY